jgi:tetratricopeptide (TPR) repeat protein
LASSHKNTKTCDIGVYQVEEYSMQPLNQPNPAPHERGVGVHWLWGLMAVAMVAIFFGLFWQRPNRDVAEIINSTNSTTAAPAAYSRSLARDSLHRSHYSSEVARSAEEIVANKVMRFGRNRREVTHKLAKHFKLEVPGDVERFFDAVESGRWEDIEAAHNALLAQGEGLNQPRSSELHQIWRPIQEAWGAAREAHNWPAQRLLEYGNSILDSLRPGMVYVGGTDPGCFIPTMLNETTDGEKHITLTQNALADNTYLDYLGVLYDGQMKPLTSDDSQHAFDAYIQDARKRLQHDQQFPNDPAQVKPGEDIKEIDNRIQVSGQVAVMAINERLFQTLMENNPNATFAMEESFPFPSTYTNATTLGPVMELGVQDQQNALTADRASQSVDYWKAIAQQLLVDPATPDGSDPRKAYSKLVSSQAGLLQDRGFVSQAEEAFRIANELAPESPEAVFRYTHLLVNQNRPADAAVVVENAIRAAPDNTQFQALLQQLRSMPQAGTH